MDNTAREHGSIEERHLACTVWAEGSSSWVQDTGIRAFWWDDEHDRRNGLEDIIDAEGIKKRWIRHA